MLRFIEAGSLTKQTSVRCDLICLFYLYRGRGASWLTHTCGSRGIISMKFPTFLTTRYLRSTWRINQKVHRLSLKYKNKNLSICYLLLLPTWMEIAQATLFAWDWARIACITIICVSCMGSIRLALRTGMSPGRPKVIGRKMYSKLQTSSSLIVDYLWFAWARS